MKFIVHTAQYSLLYVIRGTPNAKKKSKRYCDATTIETTWRIVTEGSFHYSIEQKHRQDVSIVASPWASTRRSCRSIAKRDMQTRENDELNRRDIASPKDCTQGYAEIYRVIYMPIRK